MGFDRVGSRVRRSLYAAVLAMGVLGAVRITHAGGTPGVGVAPMEIRIESTPGAPRSIASMTHGRLTVLVDGVVCASVAENLDGQRLVIGASAQADACRRAGATLTFRNGAGQLLWETSTLAPGGLVRLTNFAPRPPHGC